MFCFFLLQILALKLAVEDYDCPKSKWIVSFRRFSNSIDEKTFGCLKIIIIILSEFFASTRVNMWLGQWLPIACQTHKPRNGCDGTFLGFWNIIFNLARLVWSRQHFKNVETFSFFFSLLFVQQFSLAPATWSTCTKASKYWFFLGPNVCLALRLLKNFSMFIPSFLTDWLLL